MSNIHVYQPKIAVKLRKTVMREKIADGVPVSGRYKGSMQEIDLAKHLGEGCSVQTSKSIDQPAGTFSITIADKPTGGRLGLDSVYGLAEPQDFVELRMSHGAKEGDPGIVMRGFVSRVLRSEAVDGNGRPVRTVTIVGHDHGKVWQQLRLFYSKGYVIGQDILTNFKLFERFKVGFTSTMTGAEFVQEMVTKVINPFIRGFMPENTTDPTSLGLDLSAKRGVVSIDGPQNMEGTVYDVLRAYLDVGPWRELFIDEREEGPTVVYRDNPYLAIDGKTKINADAPDPEIIDLPGEDVMAMQVERTDADVANYYWVQAPRFDMIGDTFNMRLWGDQRDRETTIDLSKYPNSAANLYGMRLMLLDTQMGADDIKSMMSGRPTKETRERDASQLGWVYERRKALVEQNKDSVVFERGTMHIRGNEKIRAGCYVKLRRGGMEALYYVVGIQHSYSAFDAFTSTLQVERGTGFAERAKREGGADSPYLAELRGLR